MAAVRRRGAQRATNGGVWAVAGRGPGLNDGGSFVNMASTMQGFEPTSADLRDLLAPRISRLWLKLEGSPVERFVKAMYRELAR